MAAVAAAVGCANERTKESTGSAGFRIDPATTDGVCNDIDADVYAVVSISAEPLSNGLDSSDTAADSSARIGVNDDGNINDGATIRDADVETEACVNCDIGFRPNATCGS